MDELIPAVVFPPGDYLLEILNDRGWTQVDFAEIIGRSTKLVNEIIKAKTAITPTTAKEIAAATDTNPMLWLNLETAYRLHHNQEPPSPRIARHARLRGKYPVREMVLRRWIESSTDPDVLQTQVQSFFGIPDLDTTPKLAHAAKKTGYPENLNGPQLAWLFRVKQIAAGLPVRAYSEKALRDAIPKLKELLVVPEGIAQVPKILAECGVRFVVVEHMASSKIDGVCFWLDDKSPVIGMSLRRDKIDNFWFVLRHEIEHVLRKHGRDEAIIDSNFDSAPVPANMTEEERVANEAGADFCVPTNEMDDFILRKRPLFREVDLVGFAHRMQRHPGIVVGQLQRRTGRYDLFTGHQVKVRRIIAPVAMTDGYGQLIPLKP